MAIRGFNWYAIAKEERFETTVIDEFLSHSKDTITKRQERLDKKYSSTEESDFEHPNDMPSYLSHLEDQMQFLTEVEHLADELALVALYKKAEIVIKSAIGRYFPKTNTRDLNAALKKLPFKHDKLAGYASHNEVRLINNSIKHTGVASPELKKNFPRWKRDLELAKVGAAYIRLAPLESKFIQAFVAACHRHRQDDSDE